MREIGIHKEHKVATAELQSVHVGGAKTQLARTLQNLDLLLSENTLKGITNIGCSSYLELKGSFVGAIGAVIFDNDHFVRVTTTRHRIELTRVPALHYLINHVNAQREILSLIVPIQSILMQTAHVGNSTEYVGFDAIVCECVSTK